MSVTSLDKGKQKALPEEIEVTSRPSSRSGSYSSSDSSSSNSDSDSDSSTDDEITQEYLDSLLEKARRNVAQASSSKGQPEDNFAGGDEVIQLDGEEEEKCVIQHYFIVPLSDSIQSSGHFHGWTLVFYHKPTSN